MNIIITNVPMKKNIPRKSVVGPLEKKTEKLNHNNIIAINEKTNIFLNFNFALLTIEANFINLKSK